MSMSSLKNLDLMASPNGQQQSAPQQQQQPIPQSQGNPPPRSQQSMGEQVNAATYRGNEKPIPQGADSPMEKWDKIFNNTQEPNKGDQQGNPSQKSSENKPEDNTPKLPSAQDLNTAFAGHNFTNGLDEEKVDLALSGDKKAFMEVMSNVARNAAVTSSTVSMHSMNPVLEHNMKTAQNSAVSTANNNVKFQTASALLTQQNPNLGNPAMKGTIDNLMNQYADAYPDATPQELAEQVNVYINSMFSQNSPNEPKESEGSGWEDLLG